MPPSRRAFQGSFVRRHFGGVLAALLIACATVYLIGNERVSLWDRDEPRYAQTSRQMLRSGDWVLPHFLKEVRNAKPVFIYWCQALSMGVFGESAWAARLPSVLATLGVIALLAVVLRRGVGPARAGWTAFIFATSLLTILLAKMCMTDAVLLLPITVEQICLYAMWRGRATWPVVICFAAAVGIAGLTKGPVALAYPGTTIIMLWILGRRWRGGTATLAVPPRTRGGEKIVGAALVKAVVGVGIVAGIVGPWLYLVTRRDPAFVGGSLWKNVFLRVVQPAEQHSGPPGYYLITIWACYFPWSLLLPAAIATAWRHRRVPALRFALAATIGPWLMFEFIRTKLPHYLLPIYPALALMTADMLVRAGRGTIDDLSTRGFRMVTGLWQGVVILLGLSPLLALHWFDLSVNSKCAIVALTIVLELLAGGARRGFSRGRPLVAARRMGVWMLVACVIVWGWLLPSLGFLQIPRRAAWELTAAGARATDRTVMIDYKEPSLAFYQGGTIEEIADKLYLSDTPKAKWPRWIVTDRRVWDLMPERVRKALVVVKIVRGLNYADGMRVMDVLVIENRRRSQ